MIWSIFFSNRAILSTNFDFLGLIIRFVFEKCLIFFGYFSQIVPYNRVFDFLPKNNKHLSKTYNWPKKSKKYSIIRRGQNPEDLVRNQYTKSPLSPSQSQFFPQIARYYRAGTVLTFWPKIRNISQIPIIGLQGKKRSRTR